MEIIDYDWIVLTNEGCTSRNYVLITLDIKGNLCYWELKDPLSPKCYHLPSGKDMICISKKTDKLHTNYRIFLVGSQEGFVYIYKLNKEGVQISCKFKISDAIILKIYESWLSRPKGYEGSHTIIISAFDANGFLMVYNLTQKGINSITKGDEGEGYLLNKIRKIPLSLVEVNFLRKNSSQLQKDLEEGDFFFYKSDLLEVFERSYSDDIDSLWQISYVFTSNLVNQSSLLRSNLIQIVTVELFHEDSNDKISYKDYIVQNFKKETSISCAKKIRNFLVLGSSKGVVSIIPLSVIYSNLQISENINSLDSFDLKLNFNSIAQIYESVATTICEGYTNFISFCILSTSDRQFLEILLPKCLIDQENIQLLAASKAIEFSNINYFIRNNTVSGSIISIRPDMYEIVCFSKSNWILISLSNLINKRDEFETNLFVKEVIIDEVPIQYTMEPPLKFSISQSEELNFSTQNTYVKSTNNEPKIYIKNERENKTNQKSDVEVQDKFQKIREGLKNLLHYYKLNTSEFGSRSIDEIYQCLPIRTDDQTISSFPVEKSDNKHNKIKKIIFMRIMQLLEIKWEKSKSDTHNFNQNKNMDTFMNKISDKIEKSICPKNIPSLSFKKGNSIFQDSNINELLYHPFEILTEERCRINISLLEESVFQNYRNFNCELAKLCNKKKDFLKQLQSEIDRIKQIQQELKTSDELISLENSQLDLSQLEQQFVEEIENICKGLERDALLTKPENEVLSNRNEAEIHKQDPASERLSESFDSAFIRLLQSSSDKYRNVMNQELEYLRNEAGRQIESYGRLHKQMEKYNLYVETECSTQRSFIVALEFKAKVLYEIRNEMTRIKKSISDLKKLQKFEKVELKKPNLLSLKTTLERQSNNIKNNHKKMPPLAKKDSELLLTQKESPKNQFNFKLKENNAKIKLEVEVKKINSLQALHLHIMCDCVAILSFDKKEDKSLIQQASNSKYLAENFLINKMLWDEGNKKVKEFDKYYSLKANSLKVLSNQTQQLYEKKDFLNYKKNKMISSIKLLTSTNFRYKALKYKQKNAAKKLRSTYKEETLKSYSVIDSLIIKIDQYSGLIKKLKQSNYKLEQQIQNSHSSKGQIVDIGTGNEFLI